jgi:exopolysaccharide biosynthesis polyprenyl glycosylphosphotransferase
VKNSNQHNSFGGHSAAAADTTSRHRWALTRRRAYHRNVRLKRRGHVTSCAISDAVALGLAVGAYVGIEQGSGLGTLGVAAFVGLSFLLLAINGVYRKRLSHSYLNELPVVVASTGMAAAILTFGAVLLGSDGGVGGQAALLWQLGGAFVAIGRGIVRASEITTWSQGRGGHPTLILGAGTVGHLIARRLLDTPELGLVPIGFVDDMPMEASDQAQLPILGPESELESVVLSNRIEHAILSFSAAPHERALAAARRLDELGVTVSLVPRLFEGIPDRTVLDRVAGIPVISVFPTDPRGWQLSCKYAADRVFATLGLIVLSPILLLGCLLVMLDLGRPILFRQRRVGIDGQEFEMLKFRTMRGSPSNNGQANSDWADTVTQGEKGLRARPTKAARPNSRTTRVGRILRKTAVDELPQLINVACGEMSLIGPRPEMPQYVHQFESVVHRYGDRHRVKSGITGWAQVHGLRGRTSLSDRVDWDNYYIENWSPWLDLKIVLMTFMTIIRDPSE